MGTTSIKIPLSASNATKVAKHAPVELYVTPVNLGTSSISPTLQAALSVSGRNVNVAKNTESVWLVLMAILSSVTHAGMPRPVVKLLWQD